METCVTIPKFEGLQAIDIYSLITGKDISRCPKCRKERIMSKPDSILNQTVQNLTNIAKLASLFSPIENRNL